MIQILNDGEVANSFRTKLNNNFSELYSVVDPENESVTVNYATYNTDYSPSGTEPTGVEYWDSNFHTKTLVLEFGVKLQHGLELLKLGTDENNDFPEGAAVSVKGVTGNRVAFELTDCGTTSTNYNHFVGLLTSTPDSGNRFVLRDGDINDIDTTGGLSFGAGETWNENDDVWIDPAHPGYLTNAEPDAGFNKVYIGKITIKSATVGQISAMYRVYYRLEDLSNVNGTALETTGQLPVWDNDRGVFDFNYNLLYLPTLKVGGIANYTEIETDGSINLVGDASVWEDLNFSPLSAGIGATAPDNVTINNVLHKEFTSSNNQSCGSSQELPHCYKLSSTLHPHIHIFLKDGESAGTTGVTFTFYWELRQSTGVTSGSTILSATSAQLTENPHKLDVYNSSFIGAAELGAQLTVKIARTGGNAGDIIVSTFGVHFEADSLGSRQVTAK